MTSPEATERKLKILRMLLKRAARFKLGNLEGHQPMDRTECQQTAAGKHMHGREEPWVTGL